MWNKGKVPGWLKKSSLLHPRCLYGSGALIGINFDPQTAEKTGPPCLAILDVENCTVHSCLITQVSERDKECRNALEGGRLKTEDKGPSSSYPYFHSRGLKSPNFPVGRISCAKTFRTKCVNFFVTFVSIVRNLFSLRTLKERKLLSFPTYFFITHKQRIFVRKLSRLSRDFPDLS